MLADNGLTNAAVIACREWSYRFVRKCSTPVPRFGSSEWLSLAEGTPEKVAATTVAAVAWLIDCANAAANMAYELDERRRLDKAHEDADYRARAAAHRREWGHLRVVRSQVDPRAPRRGDFPGRGSRGGEPDAG